MNPTAPAPKSGIDKWLILSIVFIATTLIASGVMIWALVNYFDQKDNVDTKVSTAVSDAKKVQADDLEAKFLQRDKEPNRQFVGPDDLGRVVFNYPKTWSVYIDKTGATTNSSYQAYLNPASVPSVASNSTTQYALRVTIEAKDYDQVISSYQSLVKKGDLKTSAVKADDQNGTRLDGAFSKDIRGSAVIFKIRDKTVTIRTDADTFKTDFDALIATITFNK
ncbi:MAG: hypothetical protein JWM52_736 [Candidatus Saccharibacteria bacterium]|nr:hypothetical protein [Candidatus Saccharibacteria bacterium]